MTADQLLAALDLYEAKLGTDRAATPHSHTELCEGKYAALCHLKSMLPEMRDFVHAGIRGDTSKFEKVFRWLGFAQGVLWAHGKYTLEELRSHNR